MENVLIIIMALVIVVLSVAIVVFRHQFHTRDDARERWQKALLNTVAKLQTTLKHPGSKTNWARPFCELMQAEIHADGVVMYRRVDQEEGAAADQSSLSIICATGCCKSWEEELRKGSAEDFGTFRLSLPKDFFWSQRPLVYGADKLTDWLPPAIEVSFKEILVAPLVSDQGPSFIVLLRNPGSPDFTPDDQIRLEHCVNIADTGFQVIRADAERRRMEGALNSAHEEGMLQISTGIIHNIGNGITVIQIALERLQNSDLEAIRELSQMIESEILPEFQRHLDDGDLLDFLRHDPQGREYIAALRQLITVIPKLLEEYDRELEFVVEKFRSVTEIISLQQQFIGELGTENVVAVNTVMRDVMKLCQEPLEQRKVQLTESLQATDRILVDPAMLRHILLLIIKHAIDSASATRRIEPKLRVSTGASEAKDENVSDERWVTITISDNGAGAEMDLSEDNLLVDRQDVDDRTRDLFFCRRRIQKYGGRMTVDAGFGQGTKVCIHLPSYDESKD